MDYRSGKCSQCGAEYKIPASFAHDVAKCKVCQGVVHLEPAGGAPQPASAQPVAARAEEGPTEVVKGDAERKRKERGTLARLKAERAAAARAAAEPQLEPDLGLDLEPDLEPELEPDPEPEPVLTPAAKPAVATAPKGAVDRPTRGSSGARSRGGSRRGKRAKPEPPKKKVPVLGIVGIVALAALAAGLFLFRDKLFGGGEAPEVAAAEPEEVIEEVPVVDEEIPEVTEPVAEEPAAPSAEEQAAAAAAALAAKKEVDPLSIDLDGIEDFGPARGCTDEQWTQMNEWAAAMVDPYAGAAGNRARGKLEAEGRLAFPVLLNQMKALDLGTEEGYRTGDVIQRTLQTICNGRNFGWKYSTEPEDHYFNRKVVESWCKVYRQAVLDIEAWITMTKLDEVDEEEANRLRELYGSGVEAVGDDDLDVD